MRAHLDQGGPTLQLVDSAGQVSIRLSSDRRELIVKVDDVVALSLRQASPVAAELSITITFESKE